MPARKRTKAQRSADRRAQGVIIKPSDPEIDSNSWRGVFRAWMQKEPTLSAEAVRVRMEASASEPYNALRNARYYDRDGFTVLW